MPKQLAVQHSHKLAMHKEERQSVRQIALQVFLFQTQAQNLQAESIAAVKNFETAPAGPKKEAHRRAAWDLSEGN